MRRLMLIRSVLAVMVASGCSGGNKPRFEATESTAGPAASVPEIAPKAAKAAPGKGKKAEGRANAEL